MKALIIGNGSPPGQMLIDSEMRVASKLIAADGGANTCRLRGYVPDVVIGDLDSCDVSLFETSRIINDPDQETNDLEKALLFCADKGHSDIVILGATGYRLDQTLKNISVIAQFTNRFKSLVIKDDAAWYRILPNEFEFKTKVGATVSLFPVSGKVDGIVTEGLAFPLNKESLENGVRDGSSNRATSEKVRISHETGILLLMVFG